MVRWGGVGAICHGVRRFGATVVRKLRCVGGCFSNVEMKKNNFFYFE